MSRTAKNTILIILILLAIAGLGIGGKMLYDLIQELRLKEEYPVKYEALIKKNAEAYQLDPYLVLSIMRCESSFQEDAVSSRGAIGLMQVMPDTGAWIAHKLAEEPFHEEILYDADTNIRYGCWYLGFLENRLNHVRINIIAAYNAGHGSVEKWVEDPQYAQSGVLTSIPYPETERYVQKVTTAYENYKALYPELFSDTVEANENS